MNLKALFARKPMHAKFAEAEEGQPTLKRHLKTIHLISIGIGAVIGAGIFVITGQAAADYAGPAVLLSFVIAGLICIFAALCYAELSSLIPISGGSYSYSYVAMGEFPAWLVGWTVTAQYLVAASTVAVGWSGYFVSVLKDFGIILSEHWTNAPFQYGSESGWELSGSFINLPAVLLIALIGLMISFGIRAAAHFTSIMVVIKLAAIALFVLVGVPHIQPENWTPFIPENTGVFGDFGWSGIVRAAGLVFFAYVGFDSVCTLAQETIHPQKSLPRGILGSLGICTFAYILVALVLTGIVSYTRLGVADPMSVALDAMGPQFFWISFLIKLAILAGLASVVLVQILGQTRVFFAIGQDGLLPKPFASVHERSHTPLFSLLMTTVISMLIAGLFSVKILGQIVSMTTLFLFTIVCLGVWILRVTHPEYKRTFKVPFVPYIPLLGMTVCVLQMIFLPLVTWAQFLLWLGLGLVLYFTYGMRNSKLREGSNRF